jgi:hypothetical protein
VLAADDEDDAALRAAGVRAGGGEDGDATARFKKTILCFSKGPKLIPEQLL